MGDPDRTARSVEPATLDSCSLTRYMYKNQVKKYPVSLRVASLTLRASFAEFAVRPVAVWRCRAWRGAAPSHRTLLFSSEMAGVLGAFNLRVLCQRSLKFPKVTLALPCVAHRDARPARGHRESRPRCADTHTRGP